MAAATAGQPTRCPYAAAGEPHDRRWGGRSTLPDHREREKATGHGLAAPFDDFAFSLDLVVSPHYRSSIPCFHTGVLRKDASHPTLDRSKQPCAMRRPFEMM